MMRFSPRGIFQWFGRVKRFFTQKIFEGKSTWVDRFIFLFFGILNAIGKAMFPNFVRDWVYKRLMDYLLQKVPIPEINQTLIGSPEEQKLFWEYKKKRFLEEAKPADVVLVRGEQRISRIIQTLTRSPYSHIGFYTGDGILVEAEPDGVLETSIDKYIHLDLRICRPSLLSSQGQKIVVDHIREMLEKQPKYDISNIEKLLFKYWYSKFRPDTQAYIGGSTKFESYYICSGLIAHGFQKAGYPVVPLRRFRRGVKGDKLPELKTVDDYLKWVAHSKMNYSQIVPADFDNSPFFSSIKFLCLDNKYRLRKPTIQFDPNEEPEDPTKPETD